MNNPEWSPVDLPRRSRKSDHRQNAASAGWSGGEPWPATLKVVDAGLLAIYWLAPFFMAGRQAFGQLMLCVLASLTAIAWCVHQWRSGRSRWSFTGVEPIILLGLAIVALQCLEVSPELLKTVSPKVAEILPDQSAGESPASTRWNRISLTPHETWSNLTVIVACGLVFLVLSQRIRTPLDVERGLTVVAVGGFAMAAFGLAQFLLSNGKFFWVYEHPMTDTRFVAKGAFTNANHFANFLAMALPAQLYLVVSRLHGSESRHSRPRGVGRPGLSAANLSPVFLLSVGAMLLTGLALLLSMSRGGIVVSMGGITVALLILWRKSLLPTKAAALVGGLAIACLGATLLFGDLAAKMIEQNFNELTSVDAQELDKNQGRRKIWQANLSGIREFPILGTGLGSHAEVYWMWFNHPNDGREYSHAENGYLQIALETGISGLGIVVLLWLVSLFWCAQGTWSATKLKTAGAMAAVTSGLLISLVHSITDFVWYVPACVNVVLLFAVCAWRISLMRFSETAADGEGRPGLGLSRAAWMAAAPGFAVLGIWMVSQKLPEVACEPLWHEYLRLTLVQKKQANDDYEATETLLKRRIRLALDAAAADPQAPRVRLHAGLACLKNFALHQLKSESQMPLGQIREAARSAFESVEEMNEWLCKPGVLGEGRQFLLEARDHFQASLKGCPLQARPYLELAELAWLDGLPVEYERSLIQQAVLVRPYDARAQFAMGTSLWTQGDMEASLAHWQEAFRLDAEYRGHLIQTLAAYVPAQFFVENFHPDLESLKQLREAYRESSDRRGYALVLEELSKSSIRQALKHPELGAEKEWLVAHQCFVELGDLQSAYRAVKEAIDANPTSFEAHLTLAQFLFANRAWKEAVVEFQWCYQRKPDKDWLRTRAEQAFLAAERGVLPADQVAEDPSGRVVR